MTNLRSLYMDGHLSHADYYGFLAELIRPSIPALTMLAVRNSTDPDLNDIPLKTWDSFDPMIRRRAFQTGAALFTLNMSRPVAAWSKSDSVCVAKAYARYFANA